VVNYVVVVLSLWMRLCVAATGGLGPVSGVLRLYWCVSVMLCEVFANNEALLEYTEFGIL